MKQTFVWVLVAANVALAGTLGYRGLSQPAANAQQNNRNQAAAQQPAAPPLQGNYVMIPGESQTGVAIVYVFDEANRRLGAIAPDSQDVLVGMPTLALDDVFAAGEGVRGPNQDAPPVRGNGGANGNRRGGGSR